MMSIKNICESELPMLRLTTYQELCEFVQYKTLLPDYDIMPILLELYPPVSIPGKEKGDHKE